MENFILGLKFMIHVWFFILIWRSICYGQLNYDSNSCDSNETLQETRYTCNSAQNSCRTFLVYRANSNFQTISDVSALFKMNPDEVLQLNNLTNSSKVLKEGKDVLLPIECTCSGQFYQASFSYKVPYNTTFSKVACEVFEGMLKPFTLSQENIPQGNKPEAGFELHVPLRCACPYDNFTSSMRLKYLVTYPLIEDDNPDKLTNKFGISKEDFYAVNNIGPFSTIFTGTTILIPIRNGSIRIHDVPDSPSPPPGFLPTVPVVKTQQTAQASDLYIAGPIIGFGLIIALLASGLYVKSLKDAKSEVVPSSSNHKSSSTFFSPMRSSAVSTRTGRSSTVSCLTPDLLAGIKYCLVNYSIEEIEKATKNFSEENRIGDLVYKGKVNNLEDVMIKRIRFEDMTQVIDLHSKINHFNIVELLGVCYYESKCSWSYLVFEFPKNGCLRECLSDPSNALNWFRRTQIAFDIATCLYYLHCCAFSSYAHMNVNSRNIFITSNWRAKLADVGNALATNSIIPQKINDSAEIARGWLAPEYLRHGTVSEKVDIFAFGVVLLELISGRDIFDGKLVKDSLGFLLGESSEGGCFEGLRSFMDPNLNDYDVPEALCLSFLAKDCVADDPLHRPTIEDIMKVLVKMV